ncbi:MAG: hypothetical protein H0U63_07255 [Burkholderiales bacterium]|nr:hypothetical protein [Burkholderiales bacterium]
MLTNDYILPLLLIVTGFVVFAISTVKILGESKRRADEWLQQQLREESYPTKTSA